MTLEDYVKDMDDKSLRQHVEHGRRFLIEHPEPEVLKGRSQVRKWVECAERELKRRFPDES